MIFGSETAAALSSRGEYIFPVTTNEQRGGRPEFRRGPGAASGERV